MKNGVVLHGNRPRDNLFFVNRFRKNANNVIKEQRSEVGGINNVGRALARLEIEPLRLNPTIGEDVAYIVIDEDKATRTSFVAWDKQQSLLDGIDSLPEAVWHHFAYVDVLDDMSSLIADIRARGKTTVSADLAGIGLSKTDLLLFDFVFISSQDYWNWYNASDKMKDEIPSYIIHDEASITLTMDPAYPQLSYAYNNRSGHPDIKNTLGAGDMLVAATIHYCLTNKHGMNLQAVYKTTEQLLLEVQ